MNMSVTQVRLPDGLVKEMNKLVRKGLYSSKSDVVRDALRRLIIEQQIGSISGSKDSVKEIRKIRDLLSSKDINLDEINDLGK